MNDSSVSVRNVRKSVLPSQAIERRTRLPLASSTTTRIGSPDAPDVLPGADAYEDGPVEEPEPEEPPLDPVWPASVEAAAAGPVEEDAAVDVAGEGFDCAGPAAVLSSCICCVISDAAGLADVGWFKMAAGFVFEMGESFDSPFNTRMLAVGLCLDMTALAI